MSTQEQTVVGGRELDDLLKTLPANVEKNIMRGALRAGAAVVLPEVKQRIPIDSGQLRASARITSRYKKGDVTASVKVGNFVAWYAHLVEFGTRPHVIKVDDRDRAVNRRTGRLVTISTVNRHLRLGRVLVGPSVQHPGTSAHPFMRPAIDATFNQAVAAVTKRIRERLNKRGLFTTDQTPSDPEQ